MLWIMSLKNTIQKMAKPEGFEEYIQALILYKKGCSVHRRTMDRLREYNDPASRLAKADCSAMFKQVCKAYYAAQMKYAQAIARSKLKEKGIDISAIEVAKSVGVEFPLSMKEMLAEEKRKAIPAGMDDESFEAIREAALAYMNRGTEEDSYHRTKNLFMQNTKPFDPTDGDFEPLPPEKE